MPESRSVQLVEDVPETPESGRANLAFFRPNGRTLTHNPITMSHLPLGVYNTQIFGLVRPSANLGLSLSHNPHPTTYNPPRDTDLSFPRHQRLFLASNSS